MAHSVKRDFLHTAFRRAAIATFLVIIASPVLLRSADKPPYRTAAAEVVKELIAASQKLGEFDGDSYYFKNAGMGTGQIFRVSNSDATKFAMVGTILFNKYAIQDAEKSGFYAVITDRPANIVTGYSGPVPGSAASPQTPSPTQPTTSNGAGAPVVFYGKATRGEDGRTPTVQFVSDSKFNNDLIVWRKGHIEIIRNGSKFADLGYTGGGYDENAATKDLKKELNEVAAVITHNHGHDVLNQGWEITTTKGMRNTAVATAASANGVKQRNPYGLEGEAVAATELYQHQVDGTFTYPGYDKLREAAGLSPDSKAPIPEK